MLINGRETRHDLNFIMEIDHVIRVDADGNVWDEGLPESVQWWAPDLHDGVLDQHPDRAGWEFFSAGYTRQDHYSGPIMHDSESVGGTLARDILAQPGYYVAVANYVSTHHDDDDCTGDCDSEPEGWAVAFKELEG